MSFWSVLQPQLLSLQKAYLPPPSILDAEWPFHVHGTWLAPGPKPIKPLVVSLVGGWCTVRFISNEIGFVKDLKNYRKLIIFVVCFCWDILTTQAPRSSCATPCPSQLARTSVSSPLLSLCSVMAAQSSSLFVGEEPHGPCICPSLYYPNGTVSFGGFHCEILHKDLHSSHLTCRDNLESRPEPCDHLHRNALFQGALASLSPIIYAS